jgi:integrase
VGFAWKRLGKNGKPRYTAYFVDLRGRQRSAGTFPTRRAADAAWQDAEADVRKGRVGDPARGRQSFRQYVEQTWLPNHEIEISTREAYTYSIHKHLMPDFGPMRMIDILPEHVRAWVVRMRAEGVTPATIRSNKIILSAIFTTAMDDQVTFLHPCKGVRTPPVPSRQLQIITPEQFDLIYKALPEPDYQLLVETEIESGLRWGELTELRPSDLDPTRLLTVSRGVVEVNPTYHPTGGRFLVKDYPKDREYRRFKLSEQITDKLHAHLDANALGADDLLFTMRAKDMPEASLRVVPVPDEPGLTEPNNKGRQYRHGTLSGYTAGRCRCDHCRAAYATYRSKRRADGKDNPRRPRTRETDGHISRDWFRRAIWTPACVAAGLSFTPTMRDLRHAHASWLLAGGADLQTVKERLGHATIATTERYLHTLPDADETALDALNAIRSRRSS